MLQHHRHQVEKLPWVYCSSVESQLAGFIAERLQEVFCCSQNGCPAEVAFAMVKILGSKTSCLVSKGIPIRNQELVLPFSNSLSGFEYSLWMCLRPFETNTSYPDHSISTKTRPFKTRPVWCVFFEEGLCQCQLQAWAPWRKQEGCHLDGQEPLQISGDGRLVFLFQEIIGAPGALKSGPTGPTKKIPGNMDEHVMICYRPCTNIMKW